MNDSHSSASRSDASTDIDMAVPRTETSPTPNVDTEGSSVRRNLFSTHLSRRRHPSQTEQHSTFPPPGIDSRVSSLSPQQQNSSIPRSPFVQDLDNFLDARSTNPQYLSRIGGYTSPTHDPYPPNHIVAMNPITGRPLLPAIPQLPAHLRLSSAESHDSSEGETEPQPEHDNNHIHESEAYHERSIDSWNHEEEEADDASDNPNESRPPTARQTVPSNMPPQQQARHPDAYGDTWLNPTLNSFPTTAATTNPSPSEELSNRIEELYRRHQIRESGSHTQKLKTFQNPPEPGDRMPTDNKADAEHEELMALLKESHRKIMVQYEEERWMYEEGMWNADGLVDGPGEGGGWAGKNGAAF